MSVSDTLREQIGALLPACRWTYNWMSALDSPTGWERANKTWATAGEAAEAARSFTLAALAYIGRAPVIHVVQA